MRCPSTSNRPNESKDDELIRLRKENELLRNTIVDMKRFKSDPHCGGFERLMVLRSRIIQYEKHVSLLEDSLEAHKLYSVHMNDLSMALQRSFLLVSSSFPVHQRFHSEIEKILHDMREAGASIQKKYQEMSNHHNTENIIVSSFYQQYQCSCPIESYVGHPDVPVDAIRHLPPTSGVSSLSDVADMMVAIACATAHAPRTYTTAMCLPYRARLLETDANLHELAIQIREFSMEISKKANLICESEPSLLPYVIRAANQICERSQAVSECLLALGTLPLGPGANPCSKFVPPPSKRRLTSKHVSSSLHAVEQFAGQGEGTFAVDPSLAAQLAELQAHANELSSRRPSAETIKSVGDELSGVLKAVDRWVCDMSANLQLANVRAQSATENLNELKLADNTTAARLTPRVSPEALELGEIVASLTSLVTCPKTGRINKGGEEIKSVLGVVSEDLIKLSNRILGTTGNSNNNTIRTSRSDHKLTPRNSEPTDSTTTFPPKSTLNEVKDAKKVKAASSHERSQVNPVRKASSQESSTSARHLPVSRPSVSTSSRPRWDDSTEVINHAQKSAIDLNLSSIPASERSTNSTAATPMEKRTNVVGLTNREGSARNSSRRSSNPQIVEEKNSTSSANRNSSSGRPSSPALPPLLNSPLPNMKGPVSLGMVEMKTNRNIFDSTPPVMNTAMINGRRHSIGESCVERNGPVRINRKQNELQSSSEFVMGVSSPDKELPAFQF